MYIHFFYLVALLGIFTLIGSLFTVHLKKPEGADLYSPWIGAAVTANILILMNFSKIPVTKNIFNIPHFNAVTFLILTFCFIAVFSFTFMKKKDFGFREKNVWLYFFSIIAVILFTGIFFTKLGSSPLAERGNSLQTVSVIEEMISVKQIRQNQFALGIPVLISFCAGFLNISPLTVSRLLHGLFTVLSISLFSLFIIKAIRPSGKNNLLYLSSGIFIAVFLLFILYAFTISDVISAGIIALIANITFDYYKILENIRDQFITIEEIILAVLLLFLASINATAFQIGIAVFLILIASRLLIQKNQLSYRWLAVIVIMCLLNPLLIGFIIRF